MKLSSAKNYSNNQKPLAQGTIEYLVVIGVVIIIGLVVVSLLGNQLDSGGGVVDNSGDIKKKIGVNGISIIESAAGLDQNGLLVLKNMGTDPLTITKITIDGTDHNYNNPIPMGSELGFKLSDITICDEEKKAYTIKIYFTTIDGLNKTADFETINIDCSITISPSGNFTEETTTDDEETDTTPPTITLSHPLDANTTTATSIDFNFVVSDAGGTITDCNLIINGDINGTSLTSVTEDTNVTFSRTLAIGTYYWDVNCSDNSGNIGTSGENRSLTINSTTLPYILFNDYNLYIYPYANTSKAWDSSCEWVPGPDVYICADFTGITLDANDGKTNTQQIISLIGEGDYAAKFCDELDFAGHTDWYLPATNQILEIATESTNETVNLGDYADVWEAPSQSVGFWSSNEYDWEKASYLYYEMLLIDSLGKTNSINVRCVRDDLD